MALFRNFYRCARCQHEWSDEWTAQCDDDCPRCGARHMSPYKSEDVPDPTVPQETESAAKIRALNDALRTTFAGGRVMLTPGMLAMPKAARETVLQRIRDFKDFEDADDPYHEHDFGAVEFAGQRIIWKIDYYDLTDQYLSDDPTDPEKTHRVMTIMLASEY